MKGSRLKITFRFLKPGTAVEESEFDYKIIESGSVNTDTRVVQEFNEQGRLEVVYPFEAIRNISIISQPPLEE